MQRQTKVKQLRERMKQNRIDAYIVSNDDPHQSEYVADHWQARKWLTGFSGSAGTAVVTLDHAILWTDFRYYIQAREQIAGTPFVLFKTGLPDVPDMAQWLKQNLSAGSTVGLDGSVFSAAAVQKLRKTLEPGRILVNDTLDLIRDLWVDRPAMPASEAFLFSETYAGQTREDKIDRIREKMQDLGADYHIMTTLDDIAWTLNIRGKDVHTNPVNLAFLLVGVQEVSVFIDEKKLSTEVRAALEKSGVELSGYAAVATALSRLPCESRLLADPDSVSCLLYSAVNPDCTVIEKPSPAIALKAVKNEVQIGHLRQTAVKDGVAMVNFLFWLDHQKDGDKMTEQSAAQQLYAFRSEQDRFVDNSFDPILAWKAHSAMCHYTATDQSNALIHGSGMFLIDSGGNYLTGTTDITRTVYMGTPSEQVKADYTLVLKAHIAVATAFFPKGTKGFQIDALARRHLWDQGMDFGHGTGHGVGFFLCVHEGPARISPHPTDVSLEKGMLLTNEPGIYRDGQYGIRLENMILVDHAFENTFGRFLKFENMTWCHFETPLIESSLLNSDEIAYLNAYHESVYNALCDHLAPDVAGWLRQKTCPVRGVD